MPVEVISLAEMHQRMKAQEVPTEHVAFVCACCGTVQSLASLKRYGVEGEQADGMLGFSCVGRLTKAGEWDGKDPDRRKVPGCNWSLGGFFQIHTLAVRMEGGVRPAFQLATKEQAHRLMARDGEPEALPELPLPQAGLKVQYRDRFGRQHEAEILDVERGFDPRTSPVLLRYEAKGKTREVRAAHSKHAKGMSCYWTTLPQGLPPQGIGSTSDP